MMREISVGVYSFGKGFSSPEAAIAHAKSYPPLAKARADAELLHGSHIIDASWTDTDFSIRFSNGKFLHVFVDPTEGQRKVEWRVSDDEPVISNAKIEKVGSPAVSIKFERAGTSIMDRSSLIVARRGKEFKTLFVNEHFFYLYTPRQLILCFSAVYRKDTRENLLQVFEDD